MPRNEEDVNTSTLAAMLDEERSYIEKGSKTYGSRVQIPIKHTWLVRFLPVKLGPRKSFYARIGRHWINNRPVNCRRVTAPDFGGDPEFACPICEVVERFNNSANESVSNAAWRAQANPQWLTYCLVFEKDDGDRVEQVAGSDVWTPNEFWLNKTAFTDLRSAYEKYISKGPLSVLDLVKGSNFFAFNAGKGGKGGIKLRKDDPEPIYSTEDEAKFDRVVEKVFSKVKFEELKFVGKNELRTLADKVEDQISAKSRDEDGGRRRRDDDDGEERRPRSRSAAMEEEDDEPPRRSSRVVEEEEELPRRSQSRAEPVEEEDVRPQRKAARVEEEEDELPAPRRSAPARDEGEDEPPRRAARTVDDADDGDRPPPAAAEKPAPRLGNKPAMPPAASSRASVPETSSVEEEDNVADEVSDPAPPAEKVEAEDVPSRVSADGQKKPRSKLSERISRNIQSANTRP